LPPVSTPWFGCLASGDLSLLLLLDRHAWGRGRGEGKEEGPKLGRRRGAVS